MRDIHTAKATGIDWLPGRFLKDGANVLAKPVTDICNLSIFFNKFPSAFKLVKVILIFKKGWKTNVSNLLADITFEGHWKNCSQTTIFLNDNNISFKDHYDFRSNHSTNLFLPFLNEKISRINHHQLLNEYVLHNFFAFLLNIINCQEQLKTIQQTEKKKKMHSWEFELCPWLLYVTPFLNKTSLSKSFCSLRSDFQKAISDVFKFFLVLVFLEHLKWQPM